MNKNNNLRPNNNKKKNKHIYNKKNTITRTKINNLNTTTIIYNHNLKNTPNVSTLQTT